MTRPPPERSGAHQRYARAGTHPGAAHGTGHPGHTNPGYPQHPQHPQHPPQHGPHTGHPADTQAQPRPRVAAGAPRPASTGSYGVAARGKGRAYTPRQRTVVAPRRGKIARFVETYGWRAYAIPILVVATALCALDLLSPANQGAPGSAPSNAAPAVSAPRDTQVYKEVPEDNPTGLPSGTPADALPPGGGYALRGTGTYSVVPGTSKVSGTGGPLRRYTVEVEGGVSVNGPAFAAEVERILADNRGWGAGGRMRFQRVDDFGVANFRVSLSSSMTVRSLCGYTVRSETSCYNGGVSRAVINDARWVRGAVAFGGDLPLYHQYLITHEVGHSFGHGHQLCAKPGGPAPVMMQQTLSTGGCTPNPWPYPDGTHEIVGPPAPSNLPVGN